MFMKRNGLFPVILGWLFLLPFTAFSRDVGERIKMSQFGKQEVTVTEAVTFVDPWDGAGIKGNNSYNSLSTIVFKPGTPGESVQITFESLDVQEYASSWTSYPACLTVYNGTVDPDNTFSYPSSTMGVNSSSTLPEGDVIRKFVGTFSNQVLYSTASDGSLSVGFLFCNANDCKGWVARVETVKLEDMTVTGGGSVYEQVTAAPETRKAVALASFYIDAEGVTNADHLKTVDFKLPVNQMIDGKTVKLYAGQHSDCSELQPLEATVTEAAGGFTLATDSELVSGRNWFTLAVDIPESAPFGSQVSLEVEKVATTAHPSGIPSFQKGTAATVTLPYVVLMSESAVYKVGEQPLTFYDDGGKDGRISFKFEGTVTFQPTTPGRKVQIDFRKVNIYEDKFGSVTTNNDVLRVYDGQNKAEDALNTELHDGMAVVVKSMAADGALTVYLKSVTGDYYLKDGFEAVVSEYEPQPMVVRGTVAEQVTEGTVVAGDTDQPIVMLNIQTEHTQALTLEAAKFTAEGTTDVARLSRAALYYTGKKKEFSTAVKVGEIVPGKTSELSFSGLSQELVEGDNYFWLAYDVKPEAVTGEVIDGGCLEVTLSGETVAVNGGTLESNRAVKNEFLSDVGTFEKTVYGTWLYASTKNSLPYYDGYEPKEGDQIVTFRPGTDGKIIELDFKKFHLYYSNSSYAPKAKFEVYSGSNTEGERLWALSSVDDKDKGPGRVLRSAAPDGCLTVVFNANTTSASYTAEGWEAEVREYQSVPMTFTSAEVLQSSTQVLPSTPVAVDADIISFCLNTEGDLNAPALQKVTLDLKGCQASVAKVSLYSLGADAQAEVGEPVATAVPESGAAVLTLTLDRELPLLEGGNHFRVTFDLVEDVMSGTVIDCALKAVTLDGKEQAIANGDPEGERVIRNIYSMKSGENGTVTIGSQPLMFYDEGGPEGGITRSFDGTVTFVPQHPGKAIRLTFNQWNIGGSDKMRVYYSNKKEDKEDVLLSSSDDLEHIISFASDGSLTLNFTTTSYGSSSGLDGWEIEVAEYEIQPLSLGEVKTECVNAASVMKGGHEPMLRVDVEVKGDKGEMLIGGLSFDGEGTTRLADIARASVFATDTVSVFYENFPYGKPAEKHPYEFTDDYKVTLPGVYRFWLVYDLAEDAAVGNTVAVSAKTITVDGKVQTIASSEKATASVKKGFSGNYTVGASAEADYATLSEAVAAMADGIDGPVVIELEKGVYEDVVSVPHISGASEHNRIVIKSKSGDYRDVELKSNRYVEPNVPSDEKVHSEFGVFTFAGIDYCELQGVTVSTIDDGYPAVIRVKYGSKNCAVRNCRLVAPKSVSISKDITLIEMYSRNQAGDTNDYFTVEGCQLEGGYKGITVGANWVNTPAYETNAVIRNNTFVNQTSKSVYLQGEQYYTLTGNVVVNDETSLSFTAFDLRRGFGSCVVSDNAFRLSTQKDATAIYVEYIQADAAAPGLISNNEIILSTANASSYGIKIGSRDLTTNLNVVYNSVLLKGEGSMSAALNINSDMQACSVRNNIFQNEAGGFVARVQKADYVKDTQFSNNALFTTGTTFGYFGSNVGSFEQWCEQAAEKNSVNEQTAFLSEEFLEPAKEGNLKTAMPLAYVTTDLNGVPRHASAPTMGAYEYADNVPAPAMLEGYPAVAAVAFDRAEALMAADKSGKAFVLVRESSAEAPTADDVVSSGEDVSLRSGKEVSLTVSGLQPQTAYRFYFVLQNLRGVNSEVVAGEPFTTSYLPSEVSTFENVTEGDGYFDDGTSRFTGFTVEAVDDVVTVGRKAARVGSDALITLLNSDQGIPLTGFFLKSDAELKMTVYDGQGQTKDYTLPSTAGKWVFSNLKDKGNIARIGMKAAGNVYIDDFCGEPLELLVYVPDTKAAEGDEVTLTASPSTGVAPYSFVWTDALGRELSKEPTYKFKAVHTLPVTVTVTDAWGHTDNDEVVVTVEGKGYTATFDDFLLEPESHWNGDGKGTEEGTFATLYSGSYAFSNNSSAYAWSGFACSSETSTEFKTIEHQFRSAAGGGYNSANYGVGYVYDNIPHSISVTNATDGDTIRGFYVTNSAWVKNAVINGDGMSTKPGGFEEGDYLKLIVDGRRSDDSEVSVTCYLADYTSGNAADHYVLDTWEWVDLRALGRVKSVAFRMESSKKNSMGMTTPAYFCLDDFNGNRVIKKETERVIGFHESVIDLEPLFLWDDAEATVKYAVTDGVDRELADVSLSGSKLSIVPAADKTEFSLIISAEQKGRRSFIELPVRVEEGGAGVDGYGNAQVTLYPVPAVDHLNVSTDMSDYSVEIISASGLRVYGSEHNDGKLRITVDNFAKGVYVIKITDKHNTVVRRFSVQ